MSLSVFEMHSVELFCERPPGACYVICDEWHYKACLGKAADLQRARAETREFLAIAALNRRKWEEDRKLVRNLIGSHWLFFHDVRDRNPDTDGWWVIVALLEEVRRGKLLAVKGPRNGLFPSPYSSTPLRNPVVRTGSHPDREPILSVQYDPASWQARLNAARATRTGDRGASTLLGDAQPFEYRPDMPDVDAVQIAGSQGTPRNNQAQNKQTDDIAQILRLTPVNPGSFTTRLPVKGSGFMKSWSARKICSTCGD
ncbi:MULTISPECIES: class I SAM-dependent rRNA methyltransferase [Paraburkholderia]|uniref:class I SAM-dependent rRNA methyltransferase n=1 Tax=Paraburkholderia TaxID=1822464 RepID=UPI001FE94289|nr:class I SAM-dependent rRNA methyltransferase [Paraburkholderia podalyriae]